MPKTKCNDCHLVHGGFHLCLGQVELPPRPRQGFRSYQEKSQAIQDRRKAEVAGRNQHIIELYEQGVPLKGIARETEVNRGTIRKVITKHNKSKKEKAA